MPTEEEKKANQAARDAIQVTTDAKEEAEKAEVKEEVVEATEEEKTEEIVEQLEEVEEKVEDLKEQLEDTTLTAKERERLENRIQKERKKAKDLRDENESLKRQLAARPDNEKVFTEEEIETRSETKAQQKLIQKEFEASVNRIAAEAKKIDPEFKEKIEAMAEDYNNGAIPGVMIGILDELPNHGGDVLMYLTKHEDEYEEIHALSPAKMALKLKDISDKLKKPLKQVSKVPPPNDPLKGKGNSPEVLRDDMPMEDWAAIRARQAEQHRKRKLGLH